MRHTRFARVMRAQRAVNDQRRWIAEHGGDLAGYIDRYGDAHDPDAYGDGGPAIYEADTARLRWLEHSLARERGERVA